MKCWGKSSREIADMSPFIETQTHSDKKSQPIVTTAIQIEDTIHLQNCRNKHPSHTHHSHTSALDLADTKKTNYHLVAIISKRAHTSSTPIYGLTCEATW